MYANKISVCDAVYTKQEFLDSAKGGWLVDDDGVGHPAKDGKYDTSVSVSPSDPSVIPADATHVVWFDK